VTPTLLQLDLPHVSGDHATLGKSPETSPSAESAVMAMMVVQHVRKLKEATKKLIA